MFSSVPMSAEGLGSYGSSFLGLDVAFCQSTMLPGLFFVYLFCSFTSSSFKICYGKASRDLSHHPERNGREPCEALAGFSRWKRRPTFQIPVTKILLQGKCIGLKFGFD